VSNTILQSQKNTIQRKQKKHYAECNQFIETLIILEYIYYECLR